jgi:hypothetical protein
MRWASSILSSHRPDVEVAFVELYEKVRALLPRGAQYRACASL